MTDNREELFVPPGHFYSPITDSNEASSHLAKVMAAGAPTLGITLDDQLMKANWEKLSIAAEHIPFSDDQNSEHRYYYQNDQFSYGDAYIYYAFLKTLQPNNVVEIGSGYSSALALDACSMLDLETKLTFIEPYPERLKRLARDDDEKRMTLIEKKVQDVDLSVFEKLQANDILFIDSSHVAKTGSDVCFEIFEILPRLSAGVFILIHDMFYPFEYSRRWAVDEARSWNELYIVRAMLMHSQRYSIEFFNHYFALKFPDIAMTEDTIFMKNCGGSLWLKVNDT